MDAAIIETIRSLDSFRKANSMALYVPVRGEVNLLSLWMGSEKDVYFPKISPEIIAFHRAESMNDFAPGCYGIPEPTCRDACNVCDIDLIVVPGIAFDRRGYRLGYGKGYYDRLIENYPDVKTIGVCFDEFLMEKLPDDPWDRNVDMVVTQFSVIKTNGEV